MDKKVFYITGALSLIVLVLQPTSSAKPLADELSASSPARLIVKFATGPQKSASTPNDSARISVMASKSGVDMHIARPLSGGAQLVNVDRKMAPDELAAMAQALSSRPGVEYAEPDVRMYPAPLPNDPRFANQYYFKDARVEPGGINMLQAWNRTTGSAATVVAVIDSGIRPEHIDIAGRLAPGYDFISANPEGGFAIAADGNGRDRNPGDPGDACNLSGQTSSWHGTRVASLIGAVSNDGQGMAGADWSARILPVRALGRCGGFLSDVIDAERWAAGLPVPGVPKNANPSQIINLSLESRVSLTCSRAAQEAIDDVTKAGALLVVAAGNDTTNALRVMPANCQGVLPVAAVTPDAALASFSNAGARVALSAPGVEVLTAANRGKGAPIPSGDMYSRVSGTSFSSPLVAGVAALMLSSNSSLTPPQIISTLRANARPFPLPVGGERCTRSLCGAGLLDAAASVRAVSTGSIAAADGGNDLRSAFSAAAPLAPGQPSRDSLRQPAEFNVYRVRVPPSGKLTITTAGDTDTYGYLFNASGRLLAQDDDIDPSTSAADRQFNENFRIEAAVAPGIYYVGVEGFSRDSRGPYTLTAQSPVQRSRGGGGGGGELALGIALFAWLFGVVVQQRDGPKRERQ